MEGERPQAYPELERQTLTSLSFVPRPKSSGIFSKPDRAGP